MTLREYLVNQRAKQTVNSLLPFCARVPKEGWNQQLALRSPHFEERLGLRVVTDTIHER